MFFKRVNLFNTPELDNKPSKICYTPTINKVNLSEELADVLLQNKEVQSQKLKMAAFLIDERQKNTELLERITILLTKIDSLNCIEFKKDELEIKYEDLKDLNIELVKNLEMSDDKIKSFVKQIHDLKTVLNDERNQRTLSVSLKEKAMINSNDLLNQLKELGKSSEDNLKRHIESFNLNKQISDECKELRKTNDDLLATNRDWEKKSNKFELQLIQAQMTVENKK